MIIDFKDRPVCVRSTEGLSWNKYRIHHRQVRCFSVIPYHADPGTIEECEAIRAQHDEPACNRIKKD
jgi:hypothetical protein